MLRILYGVLERIVPALGGTGGVGDEENGRASGQPQGQAELTLRNAFKMTVYLLFSAAFPAEECYSSAKQVRYPVGILLLPHACTIILRVGGD